MRRKERKANGKGKAKQRERPRKREKRIGRKVKGMNGKNKIIIRKEGKKMN